MAPRSRNSHNKAAAGTAQAKPIPRQPRPVETKLGSHRQWNKDANTTASDDKTPIGSHAGEMVCRLPGTMSRLSANPSHLHMRSLAKRR
ncbi:MAG: hypothetical protein JWP63_1064 [Candidatus Solibacter sp.]|nr:hypothetical protein [Candidatus Solibacter sp.]